MQGAASLRGMKGYLGGKSNRTWNLLEVDKKGEGGVQGDLWVSGLRYFV